MIASLILASYISLTDASPGYVEFDLKRNSNTQLDAITRTLVDQHQAGAEKVVNAALGNEQVYYQITLDIGTPPQAIDFTIDTGSSDLWVMAAENPYCTGDPTNTTGINCTNSIYDPKLSKTYSNLHEPFQISYGDTTRAIGELSKDTIGIGSQKIYNATFAVANSSNASTCVFGIGFVGDEANAYVHKNGSGVYPTYFNVPTMMKKQNLIHTNAYSLWLNDKESASGSILFGAVDNAKFEGDLHVMPVFNNYHEYLEHPIQTRVMLNGLSIDNHTLSEFNIAVLLDSGTSFAYLPQDIVFSLGDSLGFTYEEMIGYYYGGIDTALSRGKTVTLNFSGAPIEIPVEDLLVALTEDDGSPLVIDGENQVILALGVADDNYMNILGDVFLRAMYTVFDLDHYEIAIAKAKPNATGSDISLIEGSIPGAIPVPNYASTSTNNNNFTTYDYTRTASSNQVYSTATNITTQHSSEASKSTVPHSTPYFTFRPSSNAPSSFSTPSNAIHPQPQLPTSTPSAAKTEQYYVAPQAWIMGPDGELMNPLDYSNRFPNARSNKHQYGERLKHMFDRHH